MKTVSEEFDTLGFEKRLTNLKGTQESIQATSTWCLEHRAQHKKIVASWLNVLKQVRVEQRLTLFYLANDVIQYSKRKNYEFVESWGTTLQRATTMVRDDRVKSKIQRIFSIWEQRQVYKEDFLSDLNGLLSINPLKKSMIADSVDDFQASMLINSIKNCVRIESETDEAFKQLSTSIPIDSETLALHKDRQQVEDFESDIQDQVSRLEAYAKSLNAEIKSRALLLSTLTQAEEFYDNQRSDVKVVVTAYKSFGNRIKGVKKNLEEKLPTLSSPMPSPDYNAPSPENSDDEKDTSLNSSFYSSKASGFLSFLNNTDGKLPFDIADFTRSDDQLKIPPAQPIEVINSHQSVQLTPPKPVPPVQTFGGTPNYSNTVSKRTPELDDLYSPQREMFSPFPNNTPYSDPNFNQTARTSISGSAYSSPALPLVPPPPIPIDSNDYDPMHWHSMDDWNNEPEETPVSPPRFEQEPCPNQNVIEYREQNEHIIRSVDDIDHRTLPRAMEGPPMLPIDKKRLHQDIDHRNLISLTGSPNINKNEINETVGDDSNSNWNDVDFRQPPPGFKQSGDDKNEESDMDYLGMNPPAGMLSGLGGVPRSSLLPPPPPLPPFNFAPSLNFVPPPGIAQFLSGQNMPPRGLPGMMSMNNMINPQHHGGPSMGMRMKNDMGMQRGTNSQRGRRKSENGRLPSDNVESVDMEMSDEDYEQDNHGRHHRNNVDNCQLQNVDNDGNNLNDECDDDEINETLHNMYNAPPPQHQQHHNHHHQQQQQPQQGSMGRRPPLMPTPPDTMLMPSPNAINNRNNNRNNFGGHTNFNQWDGNGGGGNAGDSIDGMNDMNNDNMNMNSPSGPPPRNPFMGTPRPMEPFQQHGPKHNINANNFRGNMGSGISPMRGGGGPRSPYFRPRGAGNFRGGMRGRGGGGGRGFSGF